MNHHPSLARLSELQQLIADFASIERVLNLADKPRPENDADHSFGLALTAWFVAEKIAPELNSEKILKYALVHDLVELYAGDTFAFGDTKELASKADREKAAYLRLAAEWPDFDTMAEYILAYEEMADEEAKFVYALDKLLPILLVNLYEKHAYWAKYKITFEQFAEKKKQMLASKYIAPYYNELLEWMKSEEYLYRPADTSKQR